MIRCVTRASLTWDNKNFWQLLKIISSRRRKFYLLNCKNPTKKMQMAKFSAHFYNNCDYKYSVKFFYFWRSKEIYLITSILICMQTHKNRFEYGCITLNEWKAISKMYCSYVNGPVSLGRIRIIAFFVSRMNSTVKLA